MLDWSCQDVADWAGELGIPAAPLLEQGVDGGALARMTVEQLQALGLKLGLAIKAHARVKRALAGPPAAPAGPAGLLEWSCGDVANWAEGFGLPAAPVLEQGVDGSALARTTVEQAQAPHAGVERAPVGSPPEARVALVADGASGDAQPLLALALALSQSGSTCKMFLDAGPCALARRWGLEATELRPSSLDDAMACGAVGEMAATGDLRGACAALLAELKSQLKRRGAERCVDVEIVREGLAAFRPDVVLHSRVLMGMLESTVPTPEHWLQGWAADSMVPVVPVIIQPSSIPSLSHWPVAQHGDNTKASLLAELASLLYGAMHAEQRRLQDDPSGATLEADILGGRALTAEDVVDRWYKVQDLPVPCMCAFSAALFCRPRPPDWPKTDRLAIVGDLRLPAVPPRDHPWEEEELAACEAFLAARPKPVYVDWGPVAAASAERTCRLAVAALEQAGMRGVVVAGPAGPPPGIFGGIDGGRLRAFCQCAVLFLGAPLPPWLLPRVVCAVHNGSVAAMQASVAAGIPSVVAPTWPEQRCVVAKLVELRLGAATEHPLGKVTARELSEKILECCQDEEIWSQVQEVSAAMAEEDGAGTVVRWLERFLREEVWTGRWAQRERGRREALLARYRKRKHRSAEAVLSAFASEHAARFPQLKALVDEEQAKRARCVRALEAGRLFAVVPKRGLLVEESENRFGSPRLGRLESVSLVEPLERKAVRWRVRLLDGLGPPEGWVWSGKASGEDALRAVNSWRELCGVLRARRQRAAEDLGMLSAW